MKYKSRWKWGILIIFVVTIVILGVYMLYNGANDFNKSDYNTGITYEDLSASTDDYINSKVTFKGEVVDKIVDAEDGDGGMMEIALDEAGDKTMIVMYEAKTLDWKVGCGDIITIYGKAGESIPEDMVSETKFTPVIAADDIDIETGKNVGEHKTYKKYIVGFLNETSKGLVVAEEPDGKDSVMALVASDEVRGSATFTNYMVIKYDKSMLDYKLVFMDRIEIYGETLGLIKATWSDINGDRFLLLVHADSITKE